MTRKRKKKKKKKKKALSMVHASVDGRLVVVVRSLSLMADAMKSWARVHDEQVTLRILACLISPSVFVALVLWFVHFSSLILPSSPRPAVLFPGADSSHI